MYPSAEKRFIRINRITIIVLFLVITAGGIVRSTGSGMGCPDWPKCFNQIIPPTDVSQLPVGYEEHHVEGRIKKNERFAKLIETFGYRDLAEQIRHDESILVHEEFNVAKTWTEYVNRLTGVIAGFCMLFAAIFSFTYWKKKKAITIWSVLNLIVVVIQAWLGSIVVSTNLTPWVITIHMLLALVIVCIAIQTFYWALTYRNPRILENNRSADFKWITLISLLILGIQVVFGTDVREIIDHLKQQDVERLNWIDSIGTAYHIHRFLGYVTLAITVLLFYRIKRSNLLGTIQYRYAFISLILVCIQMLSGIVLARFHVPAFAQTIHLVIASLLVGAQYYLLLILNKPKRIEKETRS
ncbi:COX15/CtaA family protein [Sphingobacterium sp. HJSM2_6]|uniref:COX15/CtaA family protein n=1 Tax=Sphingobacterium sp. HJSM2_6 TaxID=3366264 RepID=UPI003BDFBDA4